MRPMEPKKSGQKIYERSREESAGEHRNESREAHIGLQRSDMCVIGPRERDSRVLLGQRVEEDASEESAEKHRSARVEGTRW